MLCGTPDEVSEQIASWGDVGMDQLVFGLPIEGMHHEEVLACLELFGDKVIPEFDPDRTHSTDRYRATAKPKFPRVQPARCPSDVEWPTVIPESALAPLQPAPHGCRARAARRHRHQGTAAPRSGAAVRAARPLPGDGARDHRSGRATQRVRAQLPLRLARRAARRDPDRATATRPTSRAASTSRRSGATRRRASSSTRSSCRTPPTSPRPRTRLPAHRRPALGRGSARGAKPRPGTGPYLREILGILEQRPARARGRGAARAGGRDDHAHDGGDGRAGPVDRVGDAAPELDEPTFVENLTDVLVGVLEATLRVNAAT